MTKDNMTNDQVRMISGSILIAGGAIGYSISRASSTYEDNLVSILVLILGVPLLFPGMWDMLKSQVQALTKKK